MNLKRAISIVLLVYIVTFILTLTFAALIGVDNTDPESIPTSLWIIGIILAIGLTTWGASFYFKSKKTTPSAKQGLIFGIITLLVGFALDFTTAGLGAGQEGINSLLDYYSQSYFLITLVLLLGSTTLVGYLKAKK